MSKPRVRVQAGSSRFTVDGFQNVAANLGLGTNNPMSGATYGVNTLTKNRVLLENMYRSAWLIRKVVDCPADDMTRAGIDLDTTLDPKKVATIHSTWTKLELWDKLRDAAKWGRLYGGAVAVMMIDGQDFETPLRLDTIEEGAFRGLFVMDRWMLQPSLSETIEELGPSFGLPKYYDINMASRDTISARVHHSRIIRFEGDDLPYFQRLTEMGWGASVVEQIHDRLISYDSASLGAAQLLYKAHLRTYKVEGLRELIAAGGEIYQAFLANVRMIRELQTNEGLTVIDAADTIEHFTSSAISGMSTALQEFGQQVSGASGIPLVVLFGQSPSGFSTGDTDVRNYYDRISSQQHRILETPCRKLLAAICRSEFGHGLPKDFGFTFNPLWQQTEQDKAGTMVSVTGAIVQAHGENLITQKAAMKELKQLARETGYYSNITDEDIAAADDELPPPGGEGEGPPGSDMMGHNGGPPMPGAEPSPGAPPGGPAPPGAPKAPEEPTRDSEGYEHVKGTPKNVRVRLAPGIKAKINQNV